MELHNYNYKDSRLEFSEAKKIQIFFISNKKKKIHLVSLLIKKNILIFIIIKEKKKFNENILHLLHLV